MHAGIIVYGIDLCRFRWSGKCCHLFYFFGRRQLVLAASGEGADCWHRYSIWLRSSCLNVVKSEQQWFDRKPMGKMVAPAGGAPSTPCTTPNKFITNPETDSDRRQQAAVSWPVLLVNKLLLYYGINKSSSSASTYGDYLFSFDTLWFRKCTQLLVPSLRRVALAHQMHKRRRTTSIIIIEGSVI